MLGYRGDPDKRHDKGHPLSPPSLDPFCSFDIEIVTSAIGPANAVFLVTLHDGFVCGDNESALADLQLVTLDASGDGSIEKFLSRHLIGPEIPSSKSISSISKAYGPVPPRNGEFTPIAITVGENLETISGDDATGLLRFVYTSTSFLLARAFSDTVG